MNLVLHSTAWLLGREDERKFLEPCKPFASSYTQWLSYTDLASVQQRSNIGVSHRLGSFVSSRLWRLLRLQPPCSKTMSDNVITLAWDRVVARRRHHQLLLAQGYCTASEYGCSRRASTLEHPCCSSSRLWNGQGRFRTPFSHRIEI